MAYYYYTIVYKDVMSKVMTPKDKILSIFELITGKQGLSLKGSVLSIDTKVGLFGRKHQLVDQGGSYF